MNRRWVLFVVALAVFAAALAFRLANREGAPTVDRDPPVETPSADTSTTAPADAAPSPTSPPTPDATALLTRPDTAAEASPEDLRAAAATLIDATVTSTWAETVRDDLRDWPVVAGTVTLDEAGEVRFDLTYAGLVADADGQVVLRAVPASTALGDTAFEATATAARDPVPVQVDGAGARLLLESGEGDAPLRVTGSYRLPDLAAIPQADGPAGFGLLARTSDVWALGHWLPVPTLPSDDGPMLARGDVGAFPAAVWSVLVRHPHTLVTGALETPCPAPAADCTWLQGVGVRDISGALVVDPTSAAQTADGPEDAAGAPTAGILLETHAPPALAAAETDAVADLAADMTWALGESFGTLPWNEIDVVPVAFHEGAAGMEFPGMIWLDRDHWNAGSFARYVVAHEIGHQWFHALVGNGSLSAPVVDESLAQYAAYLAFAALYGDGAATDLAARAFAGRHASALEAGVPDEAPAQPLDAFSSDRAYGAAVYGRGAQAWVDAEEAAGRDAVLRVLRTVVDRYALDVVDEEGVLAVADEVAPDVAVVLRRGWGL